MARNGNINMTLTANTNMMYAAGSPNSRGGMVTGSMKIQKFDCGIHHLTYESFQAGCPVCDLERRNDQLGQALREVKNAMEILSQENHKLKSWHDVTIAIADAASLLDDDDLTFLKAVLYQYRDEKSLTLKVTHGARLKKRSAAPANGFIVIPRRGDPYGHLCSSFGGLAIASYFDEATNSFGAVQAMNLLVRALHEHLPGAI